MPPMHVSQFLVVRGSPIAVLGVLLFLRSHASLLQMAAG